MTESRLSDCPTVAELDELLRYLAERARGLIHTPEWDLRMLELHQRALAARKAE